MRITNRQYLTAGFLMPLFCLLSGCQSEKTPDGRETAQGGQPVESSTELKHDLRVLSSTIAHVEQDLDTGQREKLKGDERLVNLAYVDVDRDFHTNNEVDSPIRVIGGSIITHSEKGWTGPKDGTYTSQDKVLLAMVRIEGRVTTRPPAADDLLRANLTSSWMIEVNDRESNGIALCSDPKCKLGNPVKNTDIGSVTLKAKTGGGFYDASLDNGGLRFFDAKCHDSVKYGTAGKQDDRSGICERISTISVSIVDKQPKTYTCAEGECRLLFGGK